MTAATRPGCAGPTAATTSSPGARSSAAEMRSGIQRIGPGRRSLRDYAEVAGEETVARLRALARELEGVRVVHVSAAAPRNGCPELLRSLLPLLKDTGLDVEWRVLYGSAPFADVAGGLERGLRGAGGGAAAASV